VVASVLAFAFYIRVIVVMYMDDDGEEESPRVGPEGWVLAVAVGTTILWGIFPSSLLDLAADALPL
jgi:NADH:ubiquinone oxidoreductase subunit 2 (subunit N)